VTQASRPQFDAVRATSMVGKSVLIGLTYQDEQGRTLEHKQLHGRIVSVNERDGFRINLDGLSNGQSYRLPPDLRPFRDAAPGEYRLRSTGEVVVDPDLVCNWTVQKGVPPAPA